ncbi:hypothetical protein TWF281_007665 [Arthrobotrys megalospora]
MADSPEAMSPSPLLRIPQELLVQILSLLPVDDQIAAIQVCSSFHNLILYTPSIKSTRYAIDSGIAEVRGSLNPNIGAPAGMPKPKTHTIMKPQSHHPFSKLLCTSKGGIITRYAYRRCCDGQPQIGIICPDTTYGEEPTPEELEAERDTAIIALTLAVYRFNITDVTTCPFLDEPFLQPSTESIASTVLANDNNPADGETTYVTVECDVIVHRNIFQPETRDPRGWTERFKLTKSTTVREITAALLKAAFRQLAVTGLEPHHTAENVIRLLRVRNSHVWIFSLIHYRTSPDTQNMVWRLEQNTLGDYKASRRILS